MPFASTYVRLLCDGNLLLRLDCFLATHRVNEFSSFTGSGLWRWALVILFWDLKGVKSTVLILFFDHDRCILGREQR
jgi:hypothetical protein